jgi:hypothetical protein
MGQRYFQSDWQLVSLRVTQTSAGPVEFDLIHRAKGMSQTVVPLVSLESDTSALSDDRKHYIRGCVMAALDQLMKEADVIPWI